MASVVVVNNLSLDGVMQAPGRPDEDTRGGFRRGGWAATYSDEMIGATLAEGMAKTTGMLFGRRTYQDFESFWPHQTDENPFTPILNDAQKYVASTTLAEPLPWQNSVLLEGDAADGVAALKRKHAGDLVILGSGELIQVLRRRALIDRYVLLIHPLILGSGRRLFPDGVAADLRLTRSLPTSTGVIIAFYDATTAPGSEQNR